MTTHEREQPPDSGAADLGPCAHNRETSHELSCFVCFEHSRLVVGKMCLCVLWKNSSPSSPTSTSNSEFRLLPDLQPQASPFPPRLLFFQPPPRPSKFLSDSPQDPSPTRAANGSVVCLLKVLQCAECGGAGYPGHRFHFLSEFGSHSSLDAFWKPRSNKFFTATWDRCKLKNQEDPLLEP